MFLAYLLLFSSSTGLSQIQKTGEVLANPQSIEDFDHPNKGCLENSKCDQVMGHQLTRWKELVTKLKASSESSAKKARTIDDFRKSFGLPVEFYTTSKAELSFKPLTFHSSCKAHNPPKEEERTLKGTAFLKSLAKDKAIVWRDQTEMQIPTGDLLSAQPVQVYYPEGPKTYLLPLGDQPLFIKDKQLYLVKEYDDLFYALRIGMNGEWAVTELNFSTLSKWEDKKENVTCPGNKESSVPKIFGTEFCKSVWDEDLKRTVVVKMVQGCVVI